MTQEDKNKFIEELITSGIAISDSNGNRIDPDSEQGREILAEFYSSRDKVPVMTIKPKAIPKLTK